jgi:hypothetical protein
MFAHKTIVSAPLTITEPIEESAEVYAPSDPISLRITRINSTKESLALRFDVLSLSELVLTNIKISVRYEVPEMIPPSSPSSLSLPLPPQDLRGMEEYKHRCSLGSSPPHVNLLPSISCLDLMIFFFRVQLNSPL